MRVSRPAGDLSGLLPGRSVRLSSNLGTGEKNRVGRKTPLRRHKPGTCEVPPTPQVARSEPNVGDSSGHLEGTEFARPVQVRKDCVEFLQQLPGIAWAAAGMGQRAVAGEAGQRFRCLVAH